MNILRRLFGKDPVVSEVKQLYGKMVRSSDFSLEIDKFEVKPTFSSTELADLVDGVEFMNGENCWKCGDPATDKYEVLQDPILMHHVFTFGGAMGAGFSAGSPIQFGRSYIAEFPVCDTHKQDKPSLGWSYLTSSLGGETSRYFLSMDIGRDTTPETKKWVKLLREEYEVLATHHFTLCPTSWKK